jgi:hypothetical protein
MFDSPNTEAVCVVAVVPTGCTPGAAESRTSERR